MKYFISYQACNPGSDKPYFYNEVIDKHPVDWLIEERKAAQKDYVTRYLLIDLIFWSEITEEQYQSWVKVLGSPSI